MAARDAWHRKVRFPTLIRPLHHRVIGEWAVNAARTHKMNLLITGANGFIGKALVARLLGAHAGVPVGLQPDCLTLLDLALEVPASPRVRLLAGSIADRELLAKAFDRPVDVVFHLASVPGGVAEQRYELGRRINLDATVALLEAAASQPGSSGKPTKFVFASSIAVLGSPLPDPVDDTTAPRPQLSYGAQKLIGEILVEDFHRRGRVQGRSIRLPGIVARPPQPSGLLSAFLSDIIRELAAGRSFACPVASDSTTWLMSAPCVIDNLLHAAVLSEEQSSRTCAWTLPALRVSMKELVDAIAAVHGADVKSRVSYRSNPALEANFGRYPPLFTPAAEAAGFRHDGDPQTLVRRALAAS
jgi:D-erythronate 2-dehydrogenase